MKSRQAFFKQHALPALVCFALAFLLTQSGLLQGLENLTLDERTKLRAGFQTAVPADELALICIDQISINDFKQRWPWSRNFYGDLMQLLGLQCLGACPGDLYFCEPPPRQRSRQAFIATFARKIYCSLVQFAVARSQNLLRNYSLSDF